MQKKATCWICGSTADTSEHKYKKRNLKRIYGTGPLNGQNPPIVIKNGESKEILGLNSNLVKFQKNLCQKCNNEKTKPFDNAYDRFIEWVIKNKKLVTHKRFINFNWIYGENILEEQRNLFKYFVKSFGCYIASSGDTVPPDLINIFDKEHFSTGLCITISIHEDLLFLHHKTGRFLGKGDLLKIVNVNTNKITGYQWHETIEWITVFYWYLRQPDLDLGYPWVGDSTHIYLGSHSPVPGKMRRKMKYNYYFDRIKGILLGKTLQNS